MKKEAFRSTDNAEAAISLLKSEMAQHEINHVLLNENDDGSQNSSTSYSLFSFVEDRINAKNRSRTDTVNSIIVLRQYLEHPNAKSDIDPLMYWKMNGNEFVTSTVCKKYIAYTGYIRSL